jgi:CHAT domain-containing protein
MMLYIRLSQLTVFLILILFTASAVGQDTIRTKSSITQKVEIGKTIPESSSDSSMITLSLEHHLEGVSHYKNNNYIKAIESTEKALEIRLARPQDSFPIYRSCLNLISFYYKIDDLDNLERVLNIARNYKKGNISSYSLNRYQGLLAMNRGEHKKADVFFNLAIQQTPKNKKKQKTGDLYFRALNQLETRDTSLLDRALTYYQVALDYSTENGSTVQDKIYNDIGIIYFQQGRCRDAIKFYKTLIKKQKNDTPSSLIINLALSYIECNLLENAEVILNSIIKQISKGQRDSSSLAEAYNNLAEIKIKQNKNKEGLILFHKACQLVSKFHYSNLYHTPDTADIKKLVNLNEFIQYLSDKSRCLEISILENPEDSSLQASLRNHTYFIDNLINHVLGYYTGSNARLDLRERARENYDRGMRLAVLQNHAADAFYMMEKSKSFLLLMDIYEENAMQYIPDSIANKIASLDINLYFLENSSDLEVKAEILIQKNNIIKEIEKKYPEYHAIKYQSKSINLENLQSRLKKDQVYISYYIEPKNIYALIIKKSSVKLHLLDDSKDVRMLVRNIQINLKQNYDITNTKTLIDDLYNAHESLLSPLKINEGNTLIISADGYLSLLPFEILLKKSQSIAHIENYLGYNHPIFYQYSAALWIKMAGLNVPDRDEVLAISPDFASIQQNPSNNFANPAMLLHNVEESEMIVDIMGGKLLLSTAATKANLFAHKEDYSILHVASHAEVNLTQADSSYILLSSGESYIPLLLGELYLRNFPSKMVVLSACETGNGPELKGEGVMSLAKGFAYAGAQSLVSTYWQVSDKHSMELMEQFYKNLHRGHSKDQALFQARRHYLKNNSGPVLHPYFWGSFVLFGDESPISTSIPFWMYLMITLFTLSILYFVYRLNRKKKPNRRI